MLPPMVRLISPVLLLLLAILPLTEVLAAAAQPAPASVPESITTPAMPPDLTVIVREGRLSLEARAVDVALVLEEIARQADLELSIGPDVSGPITISLQDAPLDEAIKRLSGNWALVYEYHPDRKRFTVVGVGAFASRPEKDDRPTTETVAAVVKEGEGPGKSASQGELPAGQEMEYDRKGRPRYRAGELLISFIAGAPPEKIEALHRAIGSTVLASRPRQRLHNIKLPPGLPYATAIRLYTESGLVEVAEHHVLRYPSLTTPNDPYFLDGSQWGLAAIHVQEAWDYTRGNAAVVIAVIDSGIDYNHSDLAANVWMNTLEIEGTEGVDDDDNGYIDDLRGWDFADEDADPMDKYGHGTHVAGTIGAEGDNATGIAGVNWHSKVMALKVQADNGFSFAEIDLLDALDYAMANGARVVNCSFGGGSSSTLEINKFAQLEAAGILAVCAAGNDGKDNDTSPEYPASYPLDNIISVAASSLDTLNRDILASFSNYGDQTVDLMAPGFDILSTVPDSSALFTVSSIAVAPPDGPLEIGEVNGMSYAATTPATGITATLHDCGKGYPDEFPAGANGYIALIERGKNEGMADFFFSEKTTNAVAAGAIAVIIYNNVIDPANFLGTLCPTDYFGQPEDPNCPTAGWPPVVSVSRADGLTLLAMTAPTVTLKNIYFSYDYYQGTSMATPHVAGVAGLLLAVNPNLDYTAIRAALLETVDPIPSVASQLITGGRLNAMAALACYQNIDFDSDGDGNVCDNCPTIPNQDQADSDDDYIGNVCDNCPNDPDNDADDDSICGDVDNCPVNANTNQDDSDNDDIGDVCDNCPTMANNNQIDTDKDDIGDVCDTCPADSDNDVDSDTICGDVDNCPVNANTNQDDGDSDNLGDVCDTCPNDTANDADQDGVCGDIDKCPGFDDNIDTDGDGIADGCDIFQTGDISGDNVVQLDDAILTLQIAASLTVPVNPDYIAHGAGVGKDRQASLEEAIYILQAIAGLR